MQHVQISTAHAADTHLDLDQFHTAGWFGHIDEAYVAWPGGLIDECLHFQPSLELIP
jgi:hypothetical protein